jgi:hypothetical protein
MKIIKNSMRLWITVASAVSFLMGWVLLSHAEKPAPLQVFTPAISAPVSKQTIQSFNFNSGAAAFQFSNQVQSQFFGPRLRTGGS